MRRVASLACALLVGPVGWGAEPKREPMRVRAMTFNIRHSKARDRLFHWRDRRGLVAEVFRRHRPDFVGVQEALPPQLADLLEALPGYRHVGRSRDADATGGEAVPVFYRHERWTVKASGTFWLSEGENTIEMMHYCPVYRDGSCSSLHNSDDSGSTCDSSDYNSAHFDGSGLCLVAAD